MQDLRLKWGILTKSVETRLQEGGRDLNSTYQSAAVMHAISVHLRAKVLM
jgi:hypothetical protein